MADFPFIFLILFSFLSLGLSISSQLDTAVPYDGKRSPQIDSALAHQNIIQKAKAQSSLVIRP